MPDHPPGRGDRSLRRRYERRPTSAPNDWEAEIHCEPSRAQLDALLSQLLFELDDHEDAAGPTPSYLSAAWPEGRVRLGDYGDHCEIAIVWDHRDRAGFDEAVRRLTDEIDGIGAPFRIVRTD